MKIDKKLENKEHIITSIKKNENFYYPWLQEQQI